MVGLRTYLNVLVILALLSLLAPSLAQEKDYTDTVNLLKNSIKDTQGAFYHGAYERLAYLSDTYGPRMWGSDALEQAIQELYKMARQEGFDDVHLEAVKNFTKWVRGDETLTLTSPRPVATPLDVIALGGSVPGHVKAEVIVVNSFEELEDLQDKIKGKILVYNQPWTEYSHDYVYRKTGAWRAAKYGAVAALLRSVTPDSISSVHTGIMEYNNDYPKIPFAAITVQDAEMLRRMYVRSQTIILQLNLSSQTYPNTYSNNLIFQITGSSIPDQILLIGGHIDSWDTGSQTGANDDGGGFISCFEAMRLLLKNDLRPKRTIRFIAWSGEEWGGPQNGALEYIRAHKFELKNHIVAFEDDLGSTNLLGFGYSGHAQGRAIVQNLVDTYMGLLDANVLEDDGQAVDTEPLLDLGIPTMINVIEDTQNHTYYFTYHHSAGDTMSIMDPDELDANVVGIAAMFYMLADLENSIPKPNISLNSWPFQQNE